jgi:cyanophycinase-like exopeptidase
MIKRLILVVVCFHVFNLFSQSYTSYRIGNNQDLITVPAGGTALFGGGLDNTVGMKWFLQQASGGDVLVLRTSGDSAYNSFLFAGLGINLNSVETIICHDSIASYEPYIAQQISLSEGVLLIGDTVNKQLKWWRNTPVDSAIRQAVIQRKVVVAGKGEAMTYLGQYYSTEENGPVNGVTVMNNPYDPTLQLSSATYMQTNPHLTFTITEFMADSSFQEKRLLTFMSRLVKDQNLTKIQGILCDHSTAICINDIGLAKVFGNSPISADNVYFLKANCEINNAIPEVCDSLEPLEWNYAGKAIKVYALKAGLTPNQTFDLTTWTSGTGGYWENWSVANGVVFKSTTDTVICQPDTTNSAVDAQEIERQIIYPNPVQQEWFYLEQDKGSRETVLNAMGQCVRFWREKNHVYVADLPNGVYFFIREKNGGLTVQRFVVFRP